MRELTIRDAVAGDLPRLVPIFQELESYYSGTVMDIVTVAQRIESALFGRRPIAYLLLAETDARVLGVLTWNSSFPAAQLGARLAVEDLFVSASARGQSIGRRLLAAAARKAESLGITELGWSTESDNLGAQRLYESLGATRRNGKLVYRAKTSQLTVL